MKTCTKCSLTKELIFFCKDKNRIDGYDSWCKSCKKVLRRKCYLQNRQKEIDYAGIRNSNKKLIRSYERNRYHTEPKIKLATCISTHMRVALKGNKAGKKWESLVGYTLEDLMKHLESRFQPGMNWKNHSKHGWHVDHIIPKSSFVYTSHEDEQFKKCWALDNLQPLWAEDNWSKHAKL